MDAAVFVLAADPPVSASERNLLGNVAALSVTTFAVLNKADHLDEAGLAEAVEFTRRVLGEAGHPGTVYPMSARAALRGGGDGFTAFAADFTAYLSARRKTDLHTSAVAQARRIASSLLDEVRLTRRAAEMRAGDAAQRVEQFSARLSEVTVHSRDAVAVVDGESARQLFALNDAADVEGPRLGREVTGQLERLFDGELRDATAAEIERRGREQLAALAVAAAETWRQQHREAIEQALAAVDARLAVDLKAELDVLRDSATELLGLDLAVPEPEGRLAESRGSFTPRARTWARPSCWRVPSAAGFPASSADGRPGSTCAVRPRTWRTARLAGPAATCSTGSPRRRGRWSGRSSSGTPTARSGYGPRCRPRPSSGKRRRLRRRRRKENWPNGKWRCVTSWACSARLRQGAASMPAASPIPRGPTVLTLYTAADLRASLRASHPVPDRRAPLCVRHLLGLRALDPWAGHVTARGAVERADMLIAELNEAFSKNTWAHRHETGARR